MPKGFSNYREREDGFDARFMGSMMFAPCPVPGLKGPCWVWTGPKMRTGYGASRFRRYRLTTTLPHVASYQILVGDVPKGLELDHLCRVRLCANPAHLEPVTNRVNNLRGNSVPARNARKTHCIAGHPLSAPNLFTDKFGRRGCIECRKRVKKASRLRLGRH